jgi:hypothetical protein
MYVELHRSIARTTIEGVGREETHYTLAQMNIQLDQRAIAAAAGNSDNLIDSYQRAGSKHAADGTKLLMMPEQKLHKQYEKWTYELLTECRSLCRMTAMATRMCREQVTAMMHAHDIPPTLEVCIVIDNSGSMAPIAPQCNEGLVMLMEVLKHLEYPFAVATLGDARRARLLKPLDAAFTPAAAEKVLAELTFNESTHIASCMQSIMCDAINGVFRAARAQAATEKRLVILITDGLSTELEDSGLDSLRHTCNTELAVLHVRPDSSMHSKQTPELQVTQVCVKLLLSLL